MPPQTMTSADFKSAMGLSWIPVTVEDETLPTWLKLIPAENRSHVFAAGSSLRTSLEYDGRCTFGGITLYKPETENPEQVDWTKGPYLMIQNSDNDSKLLVELSTGKDSDRYIQGMSDQLKNNQVYVYKG